MKLGIEDIHFVTQPQPSLPSLWTQVIDHLTTPAGTDRLGTRDVSVTNLLTLRSPATEDRERVSPAAIAARTP